MFTANVYRIMIAAPSDINTEIDIVKKEIFKWNSAHSETTQIVLLPLHWKDDAHPDSGKHPQKILNKQLVEKSDLLVCIFGAKLGTPTDSSESGSVEEIEEHVKAGKPFMLFFKSKVASPTSAEIARIESFKNTVKDKTLWYEYEDERKFKDEFYSKLELFVNRNFVNANPTIIPTNSLSNEFAQLKNDFTSEEIDILSKWVKSNYLYSFRKYMAKGIVFLLGTGNTYQVDRKDEVYWNDFFERLMSNGFVDINKYDNSGHPIYILKKKAVDFINFIENNDAFQQNK